jgi:uncharacterized protein RhaS with RHS repeats
MNGRIYDPQLGRFLSADVVVQFPGNLQSYNRFSYVLNNPLRFTDPSGFYSFLGLEFTDGGGVGGFLKDAVGYGGAVVMGAAGDSIVDGYKSGVDHMAEGMTEIANADSVLDGTIGALHFVAATGEAVGVTLSVIPAGKAEKLAADGAEQLAVKAEKMASKAAKKAEAAATKLEKRATTAEARLEGSAPKPSLKPEVNPGKKATYTSSDRRKAWKNKGTDGKPPERDIVAKNKKTEELTIKTEKKELHHKKARRNGGGNEDSNLEEVWPTQHEEKDKYRHVNYTVEQILEERDPRK